MLPPIATLAGVAAAGRLPVRPLCCEAAASDLRFALALRNICPDEPPLSYHAFEPQRAAGGAGVGV